MDLALNTLYILYAVKPKQPTNRQSIPIIEYWFDVDASFYIYDFTSLCYKTGASSATQKPLLCLSVLLCVYIYIYIYIYIYTYTTDLMLLSLLFFCYFRYEETDREQKRGMMNDSWGDGFQKNEES